MGISWRTQIWLGVTVTTLLLLWWLGNIFVPFLLGAALAYVFNPLVHRLERLRLPRVLAVSVIALLLIAGFAIILLLLVPVVLEQMTAVIEQAPDTLQRLRTFLESWLPAMPEGMDERLTAIGETVLSSGSEMFGRVVGGVMSVVNVAIVLLLVPVIAFYLLLDWDRMLEQIDSLLPRDHAPKIRQIMQEIDRSLAAFLRGQAVVCAILGSFYAIALTFAGLESALFAGFLAGFVSFIPYLGAIIGGAVALGLGAMQFWGEWLHIGLIAVIFVIGQFVEGNILSPRLVGGSVGVHPVWVIFALSLMGALFGFVGLLIAVPASAVAAVLVRHGIMGYRTSTLYLGQMEEDGTATDP